MKMPSSFPRALLAGLLLILGGGFLIVLAGCGVGAEAWTTPEALQARFSAQAGEVLAGEGFLRTAEGFATRPQEAAPGAFRLAGERIKLTLPGKGEEPLVFEGQRGFALRVRALGMLGDGAPFGSSVTYARPGGRSYWTASARGAEEWLLLEASSVTPDAPVAIWEVEGATLRQQGEAVQVLDGDGDARLAVTAPRAYAEGGRPVEARLAVRGAQIELYVEASGEAVLVDPAWVPATGLMSTPRLLHTVTLLQNGQVLVTGGTDFTNALASAELYDPATQSFSHTNSMTMSSVHNYHTATLLPSGKVLVVGGTESGEHPTEGGVNGPSLAIVELYDPETKSFSHNDSMNLHVPRRGHAATLLQNGQVLVTGGYGFGDTILSSAELYDPATNSWTVIAHPMNFKRARHSATLLQNGQVLIAGGAILASAELYDPQTQTFLSVDPMSDARYQHTATLLPSGQVLIAGGTHTTGTGDNEVASAELYDPNTHGFLPVGPMADQRSQHTATLLPSGQVLIAGGVNDPFDLYGAELYDPKTQGFLPAGAMSQPHTMHAATLLPSGQVLIIGGVNWLEPFAGAELYEPRTQTWVLTGSMSAFRYHHTATALPSGQVLVAGGYQVRTADYEYSSVEIVNGAELYDPKGGSWGLTDSMADIRYGHTATLLQNKLVLVAGGTVTPFPPDMLTLDPPDIPDIVTASAELYDPEVQTWAPTGSMSVARRNHTATLMADGKTLIAGGDNAAVALSSAELYDPKTQSFSTLAAMTTSRTGHTATLLPNGQVLVAGGDEDTKALASAELYDPTSATWVEVAPMESPRTQHTATLLPDGQVLVTGGATDTPPTQTKGKGGLVILTTPSAEIFDPTSRTWRSAGSMSAGRVGHAAMLLANGQVLVAGGFSHNAYSLASAELFDPATGTWRSAGTMGIGRTYGTATQLSSGQVLLTGGTFDTFHSLPSAELYDPAGVWSNAASMLAGRVGHTATRLFNEQVLITGGSNGAGYQASADRYDPTAQTRVNTGPMGSARANHTATLLDDHRVLVAGGVNSGGYLKSAEIFDPKNNLWTPIAEPMTFARAYHSALKLDNGWVLLAGGWGATGARNDAKVFDPTDDSWLPSTTMASGGRWQHTATLVNGKALIAGGWGDGGARNDAEVFNPTGNAWTPVAGVMSFARANHSATLLQSGRILFAGGTGSNGPLAQVEIFDPSTNTFMLAAPMLQARTGHFAERMPNGQVLVAGGTDADGPLSTAEIYDPAQKTWAPVRSLTTPRSAPAGTLLEDGSVLLVGGIGAGDIPLATAELFRVSENGALCDRPTDCKSGFCVDAVCCDTACDAGLCDGCSFLTGAETPGVCKLLTGPSCDDNDACTEQDTCQAGICEGGSPRDCGAYACDKGQCLSRCDSVRDCADEKVCDPTNQCVDWEPSVSGASCTLLPAGAPGDAPWSAGTRASALSLLALGALAVRRRSRRAAGRSPRSS